ncbi:MAG: AAA family ATPase [Flavobacteriaceae bacterium]|jgi:predicted ATP-dependent endonuclease of OLD family|nr:AAA family ATPase [Flavobacteriaceae bacterium]
MYISRIKINNFKCYNSSEINFDPRFNLIIGENNSGKSTVFEAIRLWQLVINQFFKARTGKKGNDASENIGFFKQYNFIPIQIKDLSFLRIEDLGNIFNKKLRDQEGIDSNTFTIELYFKNEKDVEIGIPIIFRANNKNTLSAKISLKKESDNLEQLRDISHGLSDVMELAYNNSFKNRIRLAYIPPKFTLPYNEVLYSDRNALIFEKLIIGESQLILRNIIHPWCEHDYKRETKKVSEEKVNIAREQLEELLGINKLSEPDFELYVKKYVEDVLNYNVTKKWNRKSKFLEEIEKGLREIIGQKFDFWSYSNPNTKEYLQIKNKEDLTEISQLGSGTLNVLNILTVFNYNEQSVDKSSTKCNLLLLDEPDSHLHSNLQNNLFSYLKRRSQEENKQIFIITHNSSLISQFDNVIYLEKKRTIHYPMKMDEYLENHLKKIDLKHYEVISKLREMTTEVDKLKDKLEDNNKDYLILEGPTDKEIFEIAYKKLYDKELPISCIDDINNCSSITTLLGGAPGNNIIIGIYDNDHAGRTAYDNLNKKFKEQQYLDHFKYKSKENKYGLKLVLPSDRSDYEFYKNNFTIEYMFSDDFLLDMLGSELFFKENGESYYKISYDKKKSSYVIKNEAKDKISKECFELPKEAFESFKPIFDFIHSILNSKGN